MACPYCAHCRQSRLTLDTFEEAAVAQAMLDELNLGEGALEDRRPNRPTVFRLQLAMYVMVKSGMTISGVSHQLQRSRSAVNNAVVVIGKMIQDDTRLAYQASRLSLVASNARDALRLSRAA